MADDKILSYNDVVMRRSDLSILSGPHFLNDRIIEFYFSYLSSRFLSQDILLVPPSISFWLSNCLDPQTLKDFVEPLKLLDKKVIIFPVNNNDDVTEAEGGSHWSLLAFERNSKVFVHHDSMGRSNWRYAKKLYEAVVRFVGFSDSELSGIRLMKCETMPQQINGYDCGLYVTAVANVICDWHENGGGVGSGDEELWFSGLKEVQPSKVSEMRDEILKLIRDMMMSKK